MLLCLFAYPVIIRPLGYHLENPQEHSSGDWSRDQVLKSLIYKILNKGIKMVKAVKILHNINNVRIASMV